MTLGGSIATTTIPPSFLALQDPGQVKEQHVLSALAVYYNTTLTQMGDERFSNASFLLSTFQFVNISPTVNATAQAANTDLASVNTSAAQAVSTLQEAEQAIKAKDFVNATILVNEGCALAKSANDSLADFAGPQTQHFKAESVPTSTYSKGLELAKSEVNSLLGLCYRLNGELPGNALVLLIGSPQTSIQTGGPVKLVGNLTLGGSGKPHQAVLFYINGTYIGSLTTDSAGNLEGTLHIPFLYASEAYIQAFVAPNATAFHSGATSNILWFAILFNQTSIVIGDPPAYLPTQTFNVHGNLTTVEGVALPDAPVTVTFINDSKLTTTDSRGAFAASFTVPSNTTDGTYFVFARFSPRGAFGPSFNFTSVQVYHLPLNLTFSTPIISWAGFGSNLEGTATSNGTAVANATIFVVSPWGDGSATTDGTGHFSVDFPVSVLEFAFSGEVSLTANPVQPYIEGRSLDATLHLFNIFLVIIPGAALMISVYEADRLGIREDLSRRLRGPRTSPPVLLSAPIHEALVRTGGPELLRIAQSALFLAESKLSLSLRGSDTIREILAKAKEKKMDRTYEIFSDIMLAFEDFMFARTFDSGRVLEARTNLSKLEEAWK